MYPMLFSSCHFQLIGSLNAVTVHTNFPVYMKKRKRAAWRKAYFLSGWGSLVMIRDYP